MLHTAPKENVEMKIKNAPTIAGRYSKIFSRPGQQMSHKPYKAAATKNSLASSKPKNNLFFGRTNANDFNKIFHLPDKFFRANFISRSVEEFFGAAAKAEEISADV